jgi:hypothetical protein
MRLGPVQVEGIFRHRRRDQRRQQHADCRQHHRRRQHGANGLEAGFQPAIEQDQRQRHRADQVSGMDVIETQPARSGFAGNHADEQEEQQQRRAEAKREQAGQDAGHDENGAEKIAMLTESSDAMRLRGRKYLQMHAYRRHPATPNTFCQIPAAICRLYFSAMALSGRWARNRWRMK